MHHLGPGWRLIVFHGANEAFAKFVLKRVKGVEVGKSCGSANSFRQSAQTELGLWLQYRDLGREASGDTVKELLRTKNFWLELLERGVEHALLFDSQTLLLRNNINAFLGFDFVAPPLCGQTAPSVAGLSLRSVRGMIALNSRPVEPAKKYNTSEHHDTYALMTESNRFTVASPSDAALFCLECPCSPTHFPIDNIEVNSVSVFPLAMHKTWHFLGGNLDTKNLQMLLQYSICSLT